MGLSEDRLSALAHRMIDDACSISGDIVLRAAKRGVSAGELIGLVLSRALVSEEFGAQATVAWFLLDDYAEWLGQREQGIADILALSVGRDDGGFTTLRAVVTEAKYVGLDGAAEAQRTSKQQLRHTVQRIEEALFGDPGRLDRDLWLSRIADLLLDGTTALGQSDALEAVRDGIRQGVTNIDLRGYSHIFISGLAEPSGSGEQELITDVPHGLQEIFAREDLRNLLKAYEARTALAGVRRGLGEQHPWEDTEFRSPAPRVSWTNRPEGDALGSTARTTEEPKPRRAPKPLKPTTSKSEAAEAEPPDVKNFEPAVQPTGVPEPEQPQDIASLIEARALQRSSVSEAEEAWLDSTAQKLRTALLGYGLQAKISGNAFDPERGANPVHGL